MAAEGEQAGAPGRALCWRTVGPGSGRAAQMTPPVGRDLSRAVTVTVVGRTGSVTVIEEDLRGSGSAVLLVVEIDGQFAGAIESEEENDPMYRYAGIDIYLGGRFHGHGAGSEAVGLLARFLFGQRGHHRITIDPVAATGQAIRSYTKASGPSELCASTSAAAMATSMLAQACHRAARGFGSDDHP